MKTKLESDNYILLNLVKECLIELKPTETDRPGYYMDSKKYERMKRIVDDIENENK